MRAKALASGVAFRPHVKTHKTIEIARMQHGGAIGPITVSTIAEAEFFADAGFRDITYAVPIAPEKLPRAAALAARIERLNILIDSETALRAVEAFHAANGLVFDIFLKVDCGYHRAGVDPNDPDSVRLAIAIANSPAVHFQGLLTHAGHSYNARDVEEIRRIAAEEIESLSRFRALIGMDELTRSIGSTPTTAIADTFADTDEVRPGNYVFFDAFQSTLRTCTRDEVAVSVLASAPTPNAAKPSSTPAPSRCQRTSAPNTSSRTSATASSATSICIRCRRVSSRCRRNTENSPRPLRFPSARASELFRITPASPPRCTTATTSLTAATSSMNGGRCRGGDPQMTQTNADEDGFICVHLRHLRI
jgi:hypothetical protein